MSIEGEMVDNPQDYKGEPIPGGPSDPDAAGPGVTTSNDRRDD